MVGLIAHRRRVQLGAEDAGYLPSSTHGEFVIAETGRRVEQLRGAAPLPEYVRDPLLVSVLVQRMGFRGGGGPRRLLKAKTIGQLLADPEKLAVSLEKYAQRFETGVDDKSADAARARFEDMLGRLRSRSRL